MRNGGVVKERVNLGPRSYDILIGPGLIEKEAGIRIRKIGASALVVSNRLVYGLYGERLAAGLESSGVKWKKTFLPMGERYKNIVSVAKIHDRLVGGRYDRDTVVIALGGGVIGDIAGFAAATYMRGVRVVQIPTTLLSQVDSSVGGKTGVNHPDGKNLIGAFHQPSLVLADVSTLKTLSRDEILCGVAEIIKYGLISSIRFVKFLESNIGALKKLEPKVMIKAVQTSCRIKAGVVAEDELETGRRAILNFGHTVGHAVETVTGYKKYRHGFAVAIGMRAAAELSYIKGTLAREEVLRIEELISGAGLPASIPRNLSGADLVKAMERDKKVKHGAIRFALLKGIGRCEVRDDITKNEIREALKRSVE